MAAPASAATFADVANKMLTLSVSDGKPVQYQNAIRNRFVLRQVLAATSLTVDFKKGSALKAVEHFNENVEGGVQDRRACCGTMNHPEFLGFMDYFDAERAALAASLKN